MTLDPHQLLTDCLRAAGPRAVMTVTMDQNIPGQPANQIHLGNVTASGTWLSGTRMYYSDVDRAWHPDREPNEYLANVRHIVSVHPVFYGRC